MDKVSVIVPVYNVDKVLRRCVDSIISQSYHNIEIILVDDGSVDKSGAMCDEYEKNDNRVKVYHKSNGGVSSARNLGIEKMTGDWVCFVDSDDYLDVSYIEDFGLNILSSYDLYLQGYQKVTKYGNILFDFTDLEKKANIDEIISYSECHYIMNSPCFKLYRSSIIKNNRISFDLNTSYGEDHLFTLDYLLYVNRISFTNNAGYHYISNEGSLNNRIIPINQILYYTLNSFNKQMRLLSHNYSKSLEYTYRLGYENNCVRVLRTLLATNNRELYSNVINQLLLSDRLNSLVCMNFRHFVLFTIILYLPSRFAFMFLKLVLK